MSGTLDDLYLQWLYSQVSSLKLKSPSRTYWNLARQLYSKEFVWFVPNDDNRVEDGRDLRYEFIDDQQIESVDPEWMDLGCSMLELLIGLSRRLSFETEGESRDWFWKLLENLHIHTCTDDGPYPREIVDDILDTVIWRTYDRTGRGGLFPLKNARKDQRNVELWYQLNEYLLQTE